MEAVELLLKDFSHILVVSNQESMSISELSDFDKVTIVSWETLAVHQR